MSAEMPIDRARREFAESHTRRQALADLVRDRRALLDSAQDDLKYIDRERERLSQWIRDLEQGARVWAIETSVRKGSL